MLKVHLCEGSLDLIVADLRFTQLQWAAQGPLAWSFFG
jgi:hypothetical protein